MKTIVEDGMSYDYACAVAHDFRTRDTFLRMCHEYEMSKPSKRARRTFTDEFKQDAVDLVVNQGYSLNAAAEAVNVSSRSLREWHEKLAPRPEPCGEDAPVSELQSEIKRLRKQLVTADLEHEILKKVASGKVRERGIVMSS